MFKFNESSPRPAPEISPPDQYLWKKGPDGKFYATEEGLDEAQKEWLKKNIYKLPQDKKEEPPSLIKPNEI